MFNDIFIPKISWKFYCGFIIRSDQLAWNKKHLSSEALQSYFLKSLGQAETFEPVDQIVGKQKQVEISLVGGEVFGGDLRQRIIHFEFFNNQLHGRPRIVKLPDIQRIDP